MTCIGGLAINARCSVLSFSLALVGCASRSSPTVCFRRTPIQRGIRSIAVWDLKAQALNIVPPASVCVSVLLGCGLCAIVHLGATHPLSSYEAHQPFLHFVFLRYGVRPRLFYCVTLGTDNLCLSVVCSLTRMGKATVIRAENAKQMLRFPLPTEFR